jgi:ribosomal protein L7Ae-like RNA K-turn-binding protein/predicted RNA-binding protein YlxR (DUF448 family)
MGPQAAPNPGPASPAQIDLVRLVLGPEGDLVVDGADGAFGRGAHVHGRPACLEKAARGGLARSFKGKATSVLTEDGQHHPVSADVLARAIQEAMYRRIEGLLTAAVRSRRLARGADAVTEACRRGEAELVVVATDAAAAADLAEVQRAVSEGRAVAWADKLRLGRTVTLSKPSAGDGAGVAVVALLSRPIAQALQQAVHVAGACAGVTASPPRKGGGRAGSGARTGDPARKSKGVAGDQEEAGNRGDRRGRRDHRSDG